MGPAPAVFWLPVPAWRHLPRGRRVTPRGRVTYRPGSALGDTKHLPWEMREPRGSGLPPLPSPVRAAAGGDAPAAPARRRCGPAVPLPAVSESAGPCLPARRAAGAPPAAARTPSAAPLRPPARPGLSRPPAGGRPRLTWRGVGAGGAPAGDGARQPPPSAPSAAFVCAVTWAAVRDLSGSPQDMP